MGAHASYSHSNKNKDWNLISFSTSSINNQLKTTISEFGYHVIATSGSEWLDLTPNKLIEPTILLFGRDDFPRKKLIKILDHSFGSPSVGVFAESCVQIDSEFTCRFDDFFELPCSRLEMKARLDRVLRLYHPGINLDQDEILAEFAKLNLIGESPSFVVILHDVKRFSKFDAPILLTGETGTGKELIARAVHYQSKRRDFPFIPVNCGALPDNLVENELFGHEKGAYTDACVAQKGLVEQADDGTLFLDEVDSLSQKAQISLLRFLQDNEFRPLGGKQFRTANVRIIAATNADLAEKVAEDEFRNDLYYRLNILPLNLPPLRERKQDIFLLATHFLDKFARQYGFDRRRLSPVTLNWMMHHAWPGNIRELENFILRACLTSDGKMIHRHSTEDNKVDLQKDNFFQCIDWHGEANFADAKTYVIAEFEKNYLHWLLRETNGNVSDAARRCGKERRALGKLLKKYSIDKSKYYPD